MSEEIHTSDNVGTIATAHATFAHPQRNVDALGLELGMKVVDIGAGSGAYIRHLAHAVGESGAVYAVDVQKDLLRRIESDARHHKIKNVTTIWADVDKPQSTRLPAHSIDFVLISNILFQLEDKREVFHEAKRILKREGGKVAIIDWNESYGGMGPHPHHVVHKNAAIVLAKECGLTLESEFAAGGHHYGLIMHVTRT